MKGGTDATKDDTLLDGFTIKGGDATWGFLYGGGMYNNSSAYGELHLFRLWRTLVADVQQLQPDCSELYLSGNTSEDLDGGRMYNKNSSLR